MKRALLGDVLAQSEGRSAVRACAWYGRATVLGTIAATLLVFGAPVELRWTAPPACPSEADVQARVEHYLQGQAPTKPVVVEAEVVDAGAQGWRLSVTVGGEAGLGTRTVVDLDCEGLAETTAVLTALAIAPQVPDPEPTADSTPEPIVHPEPEAEPKPEPEPVAQPHAPSAVVQPQEPHPPSAPRRAPLRWGLRASAGLGVGWLPIGADAGVALTVGRSAWSAEVEAMLGLPREVRLEREPSVGADLLAWSVAARGCGVLTATRWLQIPLCAGVEGGLVHASPHGLQDANSAARPWLAGLVSPSLRAQVHRRVALWLQPELQLGAVRPGFHASDGRDRLFEGSIASGRARVGVEWVF